MLKIILDVLGGFLVLWLLYTIKPFVVIGGSEIGVVERRYFGAKLPAGRVIALPGQIGVQAKMLSPGLHLLIPFVFAVKKASFLTIHEDEIGVVESVDGEPVPAGQIFARSVQGHDFFQDAEVFLKNGGQKGPQVDIIPPGTYRINPRVFQVTIQKATHISQNSIGVVEAVDGEPIPAGRIFARSVGGHNSFQNAEAFLKNGGQKGPQVDIIPPGTYRINPGLFRVTAQDVINVPQNSVGKITSMDGASMDAGRLLAKSVDGHDNFQNGNAFLSNGGQKGPQAGILFPGTYRINPRLFTVEMTDATAIPAGKIGLVTAKDGMPLPEKELVARSVTGHDNYQDASKFLANGGQRGPQLDVLPPGTYYINPLMFTVEMDDAMIVNQGQVAVTISNVGEPPTTSVAVGVVEEDIDKVEQYVVPSGYRGIQANVLGPGTYYLNKLAYREVIVNTTNITIDWEENNEKAFDTLQVVSKDGFLIKVGVKVVMRVQPQQAPYMVARIGSLDNLITNVVHPNIDSSFRNQASSTQAMEFLQDRHEQQERALERARNELSKYHVEVLSVLICQITLPEDLMKTQTNKVIAAQQQSMYDEQRAAQQKRIEMERTTAEANQQAALVTAQIGVKVAEQEKQKTITTAQGTAERMRLEGEGEASKIRQIGEATANAYELTSHAIGAPGLTNIEMLKLISSGNIKITPEIMVSGDSGGSLVNVLLSQLVAKNVRVNTDVTVLDEAAATAPVSK